MASSVSTVYYDSNYNFYVNDYAYGIWYKIDNNDLQYCEGAYNTYNPNNPVYIKIDNIDYNLAQEIDDLPELTTLTVSSEIYNQIKEGIYYFSNESQSGGGISMSNSVKKTIIMKRINNVLYNIFPKSSADNIVFTVTNGDDTTVQLKLDDISSSLASAVTSSGLNSSIQTEFNSLYNRIMGFVDNDTTINEAYDTLKEVATYLAEHDSVVTQIISDISSLQSTVGDSNSGLVKDVNDLKTTVGGSSSGLVQSNNTNINNTSTLQTTINNKSTVTSSSTNGNIKINGTETTVYTPSNIPASAITESNTKKFITNDEKNKINEAAKYNIVATQPTAANANSTDLYIMITEQVPSPIDPTTNYEVYGKYSSSIDSAEFFKYGNNYYALTNNEIEEIFEGDDNYYYINGSDIESVYHEIYNDFVARIGGTIAGGGSN